MLRPTDSENRIPGLAEGSSTLEFLHAKNLIPTTVRPVDDNAHGLRPHGALRLGKTFYRPKGGPRDVAGEEM